MVALSFLSSILSLELCHARLRIRIEPEAEPGVIFMTKCAKAN
jgi:hypothetical protein